jgi:hypothetical protein
VAEALHTSEHLGGLVPQLDIVGGWSPDGARRGLYCACRALGKLGLRVSNLLLGIHIGALCAWQRLHDKLFYKHLILVAADKQPHLSRLQWDFQIGYRNCVHIKVQATAIRSDAQLILTRAGADARRRCPGQEIQPTPARTTPNANLPTVAHCGYQEVA